MISTLTKLVTCQAGQDGCPRFTPRQLTAGVREAPPELLSHRNADPGNTALRDQGLGLVASNLSHTKHMGFCESRGTIFSFRK